MLHDSFAARTDTVAITVDRAAARDVDRSLSLDAASSDASSDAFPAPRSRVYSLNGIGNTVTIVNGEILKPEKVN